MKGFAVIQGEKLAAHSGAARPVQFDADGAAGPRVCYLPRFIGLPVAAALHFLAHRAVAIVVVGVANELGSQLVGRRAGRVDAEKRWYSHRRQPAAPGADGLGRLLKAASAILLLLALGAAILAVAKAVGEAQKRDARLALEAAVGGKAHARVGVVEAQRIENIGHPQRDGAPVGEHIVLSCKVDVEIGA
nr:hypothetical protein [Tanacetum cinerariifolium]